MEINGNTLRTIEKGRGTRRATYVYLVRDNMLVPLRLLFKPENRSSLMRMVG
ncbi:hypothetical protein [Pyrococcus kukulkanii]|uniref:Uncharacterized protein n=1 Tax=Pyrococcus kukulkanii TaxID=1609559 RepID=A0ABV4T658_9EURY|nr:hypothetical protein [Pyrococcus kukulkanii]